MSKARFRVAFNAPVDGGREATVEIDRRSGLFSVRILRRRQVRTVPLSAVAEMVVWRLARAEAAEKAKAKRKQRRAFRALVRKTKTRARRRAKR